MSGRWVDLREAAELLNTSTEAVRKRATRGSLRSDRHDGQAVVWVDEDRTEGGREAEVDGGPLVEDLREQVAYLRSILTEERDARRRADTFIAQLTQANAALAQRVPELEAPQEPLGTSKTFEAEPGGALGSATGIAREGTEQPPRRSWWRTFFGFE